jgi:hypothetical protein
MNGYLNQMVARGNIHPIPTKFTNYFKCKTMSRLGTVSNLGLPNILPDKK